jgi:3-oxoacid CoA-transferase subunit A
VKKVYDGFVRAVSDIADGASIMIGLFGGPAGTPQNLIAALRDRGVKNLTVIVANFGFVLRSIGTKTGEFKPKDFISPSILLENKQVKKAVVNWTRPNRAGEKSLLEEQVKAGEVQVEIMPMGVQVLRMKAGGMGIGAFYCPVGVDTSYAKGKEKRVFDGKEYILERPLRASVGFVKAHKADKFGNLVCRGTGREGNPLVAKACDLTIAEVDEVLEPGEIDPDQIHIPGIYIDRIVKIPEGGWR